MIVSFRNDDTRLFFEQGRCRKDWETFKKVATRKLDYLNAAMQLRDLASPPGNKLEPLRGDRDGQHSIRINDQYRICFRWSGHGPEDVEIVDYHN